MGRPRERFARKQALGGRRLLQADGRQVYLFWAAEVAGAGRLHVGAEAIDVGMAVPAYARVLAPVLALVDAGRQVTNAGEEADEAGAALLSPS